MPAYRDSKTGTWYVAFKEKDLKGNTKGVHKRGFETKKEAQKWENDYKNIKSGSLRMTFKAFVEEVYLPEIKPKIKETTYLTKTNMIEKHILPYFSFLKLNEIEPKHVIKWQNEMLRMKNSVSKKSFSKSYLQSVNSQLVAILSYAVKYYNLPKNAAQTVGNMGNEDEIEMNFWTLEQYKAFAAVMMNKPIYYYAFQVLYWTGIREGELFALQWSDINFKQKTLSVSKTLSRIGGQDIVTSPKTKQSYRKVTLPDFLVEELKEFKTNLYQPTDSNRVFELNKSSLSRALKKGASKAGVPEIRVHDLRHSHVSLLINNNYTALAIGKRVGHKAVDITYRYAHMFPTIQEGMAEKLNALAKQEETDV